VFHSVKLFYALLVALFFLSSCSTPPHSTPSLPESSPIDEDRSGGRRCNGDAKSCAQLDEHLHEAASKKPAKPFQTGIFVRARFDSLQILGNVEEQPVIQEALEKLFRNRSPALRKIFLEARESDSTLQGQMWVSFGIQTDGAIGPVKTTDSTFRDPIFDSRVARKIKSWKQTGVVLKAPAMVMFPLDFGQDP